MADDTYGPKVYMKQDGDEQIVAAGGKITTEGDGVIDTSAQTGGLVVAAGEIEAADLATDAVETAKIKALAVTAAKLATDAVETAKIKNVNVTAAKLATDAVETAKIKALAVTQAKLEEGSMVFVDKQLTNAEVLAFRATPIELIAAPGANKAIIVHKFIIVSDDSAGTWTETTDNLVIEYADGVDISAAIVAADLVGGAVVIKAQGVLDTALVPDVNAAVQLFNTGDGEWGGGNAANTLSVRTWYSVIDTVAFS